MTTTTQAQKPIEKMIQLYGDILYDLCESVLWSPANAQIAFQTIARDLKSKRADNQYVSYERSWVLKIACKRLQNMAKRHGRRLTPSEQIMLDASLDSDARLKQFDSYFHRLPTDDQVLLLLRDKYGLPYPEISSILGMPEGSLKICRQQALRTLQDWLWNRP